ncbi:MAG: hypothetical protein QM779_08185 [Propionicimonas sp.]|uniref:hypothetical protein n=1 Tax=Propionicimonas sp. TaxID=1955623 RepID=UPI003D10BFCC
MVNPGGAVPRILAAPPAFVALVDAIRATQPPCWGRKEWLSESPADRFDAAVECVCACPHLTLCRAAGRELGADFGVWGGVDRGSRRRAEEELEDVSEGQMVGPDVADLMGTTTDMGTP